MVSMWNLQRIPAVGPVVVWMVVVWMMMTVFSVASALQAVGPELSVPDKDRVCLKWDKVSCTLKNKKHQRHLLQGVCGAAKPGRLLVIMGPSGSGKTTLLNALSGQLRKSKGLHLEGIVHRNDVVLMGEELSTMKKAYVRQEDIFYTQMTVRETLLFHARLRLPKGMPLKDKQHKVEAILGTLGLRKCADTLVGGDKVRGISGGERKRLNIGCELIAAAALMFLDEPTTGLDSFQAEKVVCALKELAKGGHTVIAVMHQPSAAVFSMFDDLLLLSEGRQMYYGEASGVSAYLKSSGYPCPPHIPAPEFSLSLVSVNHETADTSNLSAARVTALASDFATNLAPKYALPATRGAGEAGEREIQKVAAAAWSEQAQTQASVVEQGRLLLARAWREVARNRGANLIKLVQQVSTALIYGGIYSFSDSQSSIQDRLGLCSLVAIGNTNLALASTIRAFPKEKSIVMNDRSKALYGALPYFVSKVLAEAPISAALSCLFGGILYPLVGFQRKREKFQAFLGINVVHSLTSSAVGLMLGALAPSSEVALAMLPPIVILQIVFNGANIAVENTPRLLSPLPRLSVVRWGFEGLALNEMRGLALSCDLPPLRKAACVATGEEALARISKTFDSSSVHRTINAQLTILALCYLATMQALSKAGPQYAPMHPPARPSDERQAA